MLRAAVVATMAAALLAVACSGSGIPYGLDNLENMYRFQRLYQMSELENEDPYLSLLPVGDMDPRSQEEAEVEEALGGAGAGGLWGGEEEEDDEGVVGEGDDEGGSLYGSPLFRAAQARDSEHIQHSALQGLHQVAGGTAEGNPPMKQVKTDKPLPAYCNPPNPCPVGKTAADNCVEEFENSLDNNKRLLQQQDCPCDTEHMWSCPAGQQTVTSKGAGGQAALSKVMSELAQLHTAAGLSLDNNPYLTSGVKREHVVAKKSPGMMRRKRSNEEGETNPYLVGQQMNVAAKKSPPDAFPQH